MKQSETKLDEWRQEVREFMESVRQRLESVRLARDTERGAGESQELQGGQEIPPSEEARPAAPSPREPATESGDRIQQLKEQLAERLRKASSDTRTGTSGVV